MPSQTAFGGMLQDVVELNSIVLRPEPLDDEIERRCKQAWEQAACPECGQTSVQSGNDSPRVWCRNCRYTFTYTRNTPFEGRTLSPGEIVLVFVLYVDTLLSIHQIAQLFEPVFQSCNWSHQILDHEKDLYRPIPHIWPVFQSKYFQRSRHHWRLPLPQRRLPIPTSHQVRAHLVLLGH